MYKVWDKNIPNNLLETVVPAQAQEKCNAVRSSKTFVTSALHRTT